MTGERWLIVGLGNPGPGYAANRHNAGYMVADVLAARAGAGFRAGKFQAAVAEGRLAGQPVTLGKPLTFMNLSGGPVAGLCRYYRVPPGRLLVIHDELDIPFGTIRLKQGGGDNGHNGLRSVTASLGTREYYRLRFGIGRPRGGWTPPCSCCVISPPPSARSCRSCWTGAPTRRRPCSARGSRPLRTPSTLPVPGRTAAPADHGFCLVAGIAPPAADTTR